MALDNFPPNATPAREQAIRDAVSQGNCSFSWATITSDANGHHAEFQVFSDALMIDGVRVNVSAETEQIIADLLDCSLLTPKLADLIWLQRDCTIAPHPMPISSTTQAMIQHSAKIDADIAKLSAPPTLVCSNGKHWVIDNELLTHPGMAENYGWHFAPGGWTGPTEYAVTKDPQGHLITMIQGRGWRHDMHHVDYSQICVLVSKTCAVDGNTMRLSDVLTDPQLAPLASHQGVMKVFRQPGVPDVTPTEPAPPPSGSAA